MDVVKNKKIQQQKSISKTKLGFVVLLVLIITAWATSQKGSVAVERNNLLIDIVKNGNLNVTVEGYGTLVSDKQQLITAFSSGIVKEVILKPGAAVTTNSVIVQLENPELLQQLDNEKQELSQVTANLRQLKLNNQREQLNESANLAEIISEYEAAKLRHEAEKPLVQKGIVSRLNFQQTILTQKQLEQRIDIYKQRQSQLRLVHNESVNIQTERINQQQGRVDIAQSRIDKLTIKAGFNGVLQRLSVELGQSLSAGQEIALIGSVTELIALIGVPQNQVHQIKQGQSAVIDTRRGTINGTVTRISPVVVENRVEIEIALPNPLPSSARPQSTVDGVITTAQLSQVHYIKRPAGVRASSESALYKINTQSSNAVLQPIRFGQQAGDYIQLLSPVKVGEQYIISDLRHLQNTHQQLIIE